jgi:uncharacterized protein involved in exopolysaccharide biosynthesis
MSPKGKRDPETTFLSRTNVSPEKTAAEIQELLGARGARRVMTEYQNNEISGLSFSLLIQNREVLFRLPVRWREHFKVLQETSRKKKRGKYFVDQAQARRTAWRVAKAWLEAQLALIASGMADLEEVMLPYSVQGIEGQTLYEKLKETGFLLEYKE